MFKFLTNNEEYSSNNRQDELVDILNTVHGVFYYHTDTVNNINMCLDIYMNIYNQIINGNYFTPFDIFERYTNEYRSFGEQQPGFNEMEFMMLRDEAERKVRYNRL